MKLRQQSMSSQCASLSTPPPARILRKLRVEQAPTPRNSKIHRPSATDHVPVKDSPKVVILINLKSRVSEPWHRPNQPKNPIFQRLLSQADDLPVPQRVLACCRVREAGLCNHLRLRGTSILKSRALSDTRDTWTPTLSSTPLWIVHGWGAHARPVYVASNDFQDHLVGMELYLQCHSP